MTREEAGRPGRELVIPALAGAVVLAWAYTAYRALALRGRGTEIALPS